MTAAVQDRTEEAARVGSAGGARSARRRFGLLFVLPALIPIVVFHVGAALFNVVMSTTNWSLAGASFIGVTNYVHLLTSRDFLNSLVVTAFYVLGTAPVALVLAIPLAYLLHFRLSRFTVYRVIVFTPYVVPTVATGLVFGTIFGPTPSSLANWVLSWFGAQPKQWLLDGTGIVNVVLGPLGVHLPGYWAGPSLSLTVAIAAQVWNLLGFTVIVLLSALTALGPELPEAARIDGASEPRILRSIVLPQLAPTMLFLGVVLTIFSVREFNLLYILTQGGPDQTSETLTILMVREFYENNALGYGSTVGIVLALGVAIFSFLQFRIARRARSDG